MLDWFSLSGIRKEVKGQIRWPKFSDLVEDSKTVVSFVFIFALLFVAYDFIVSIFFKLIGLGL